MSNQLARQVRNRLEPGDEVHFVSLLDEEGNTLMTCPMAAPTRVPVGEEATDVSVDVRLQVHMTIKGTTHA